jgi:hypothetical protein
MLPPSPEAIDRILPQKGDLPITADDQPDGIFHRVRDQILPVRALKGLEKLKQES